MEDTTLTILFNWDGDEELLEKLFSNYLTINKLTSSPLEEANYEVIFPINPPYNFFYFFFVLFKLFPNFKMWINGNLLELDDFLYLISLYLMNPEKKISNYF